MSREEIHKLLGGYATGTLTPDEQQALFQAALEDQELFDELAREQSLRDLLRDPAARAQLLAAADSAPAPWYRRLWRPAPAFALAVLATAVTLVAIVVVRQSRQPQPVSVAKLEAPAAPQPAAEPPVAAPAAPAVAPVKELPRPKKKVPELAELNKETVAAPVAAPAAAPPPPIKDTAAPARLDQAVAALDETKALEDRAKKAELASAGKRDAIAAQPVFQSTPVGGVAEQRVEVTAASTTLLPGPTPPGPSVQYHVLRKTSGGDFVEVPNDGNVAAGTPIKLRLIPSDSGTLRVVETTPGGRSRELVSRRVEGGEPFETKPLEYRDLGRLEFQVSLVRLAGAALALGRQQFQAAGTPQSQSQNQNQTEDLKQSQAQKRMVTTGELKPAFVTIVINIR